MDSYLFQCILYSFGVDAFVTLVEVQWSCLNYPESNGSRLKSKASLNVDMTSMGKQKGNTMHLIALNFYTRVRS